MSSELIGRHLHALTQVFSSKPKFLIDALSPQPTDTIPLQIENPNWLARLEASIFGKDLELLLAKLSFNPDKNPRWWQVLLDNGYQPVGIYQESILAAKLFEHKLDRADCLILHIWPGDLLTQTKGITQQSNFKLVMKIPQSSQSPWF